MRSKRKNGNGTDSHRMSRAELLKLAENEAQQMLGVPSKRAFKMLAQGKLHGSIAEAEFRMLKGLLSA